MLTHYNPEPMHVYTDSGRFYQIGDHLFPGVGSVQDATRPDIAKQWKQWRETPENAAKSKAACDRGTLFHQAMQYEFMGALQMEFDVTPDTFAAVNPYLESVKTTLPLITNPQLIESAIWHDIGCYAGTVDLAAEFEGELSIIDWKTSEQPKTEIPERYLLQLAAYCGAVNRMYGLKIKQGVIVAANSEQEAQVFKFQLGKFWRMWIQRVKQYWHLQAPDEFALQTLEKLEANY